MERQVRLQSGMDVYGSDGDKIGSIHDVFDRYVMVAKGFFFPKDYFIPLNAIEGVDEENRVYLNVSKDQALDSGWDVAPDQETETLFGTATGDAGYTPRDQIFAGSGAGYDQNATEVVSPDYVASSDMAANASDSTRVPVYEEDLTATTRPVDRGSIRIEKEQVTEDRTVTVPVTEERVRITRLDGADATSEVSTSDAFRDEVIEVPVRGEEVDLNKSTRLAGEVVVEKEAVRTDKQVSGKVRREEVRVDDSTVSGQTNASSEPTNPLA